MTDLSLKHIEAECSEDVLGAELDRVESEIERLTSDAGTLAGDIRAAATEADAAALSTLSRKRADLPFALVTLRIRRTAIMHRQAEIAAEVETAEATRLNAISLDLLREKERVAEEHARSLRPMQAARGRADGWRQRMRQLDEERSALVAEAEALTGGQRPRAALRVA
jgi:hypothetical protein